MEKAHTTEKGYVGSMDTHFWTSPCRGRIFLTVCYSGLKHCLTQGMYNLRTPWGYERKYNSVWYHCFIRLSLVVFFGCGWMHKTNPCNPDGLFVSDQTGDPSRCVTFSLNGTSGSDVYSNPILCTRQYTNCAIITLSDSLPDRFVFCRWHVVIPSSSLIPS